MEALHLQAHDEHNFKEYLEQSLRNPFIYDFADSDIKTIFKTYIKVKKRGQPEVRKLGVKPSQSHRLLPRDVPLAQPQWLRYEQSLLRWCYIPRAH